ncbi:hypothetical protein BJ546DRAFT_185816 [Cryomyces antarcticus]
MPKPLPLVLFTTPQAPRRNARKSDRPVCGHLTVPARTHSSQKTSKPRDAPLRTTPFRIRTPPEDVRPPRGTDGEVHDPPRRQNPAREGKRHVRDGKAASAVARTVQNVGHTGVADNVAPSCDTQKPSEEGGQEGISPAPARAHRPCSRRTQPTPGRPIARPLCHQPGTLWRPDSLALGRHYAALRYATSPSPAACVPMDSAADAAPPRWSRRAAPSAASRARAAAASGGSRRRTAR